MSSSVGMIRNPRFLEKYKWCTTSRYIMWHLSETASDGASLWGVRAGAAHFQAQNGFQWQWGVKPTEFIGVYRSTHFCFFWGKPSWNFLKIELIQQNPPHKTTKHVWICVSKDKKITVDPANGGSTNGKMKQINFSKSTMFPLLSWTAKTHWNAGRKGTAPDRSWHLDQSDSKLEILWWDIYIHRYRHI